MASYEVQLVDEFSSPAKSIVSAMREMKALARSMRGPLNSTGDSLKNAGAGAGKAKGMFAQLKGSLFGSMTAAGLAAGAITSAASALFGFAKAGAGAVAQAILFRESLEFSLTRFLGSSAKAGVAMERISDVANEVGLSFQEAGSQFKNFVSAGFSEDAALELLKFKKDIIALGDGSQRTSQRIDEAFIQIEKAMATGKIEADGFTSILANLPVTQLQVMKKLAPKIGKNWRDLVDDFGKLKVEVTKLPVAQLMEAFQEATLAATGFGAAGEAAVEKAFTTLPGALDFLTNKVGNIPDQIASKVGDGAKDAILPLMKKLSEALDSDFVQGAIQFIADQIVGLMESLAEFADSAAPFFEGFASGWEAVQEVMGPIRELFDDTSVAGDASASTMESVGEAVGFLAAALVGLVEIMYGLRTAFKIVFFPLVAIYEVIALVIDVVKLAAEGFSLMGDELSNMDIGGAIGDFFGQAASLGSSIIDGIVSGISGAADAVVSAVTGVVGGAIDSAKSLLGIKSPSKVFEDIGDMTGKGLLLGIDANARAANDAFSDLVSVPQAPTAGGAGVSGLSAPSVDPSKLAAAGKGGDKNLIQITIDTKGAFAAAQSSQDPVAFSAAVKHMIVEDLTDELEERLLMLGQAS